MQGHHYQVHRTYITEAFTVFKTAASYSLKPHSTPIPFRRTSLVHSANPDQLQTLVFMRSKHITAVATLRKRQAVNPI